jgi:phosphatidylglycerol:prolipoprotein diacylglycerol transferase
VYPVLFHIGSLTIYAYGTFLAIAFIVGLVIARIEFKKRDINPDIAYDLVLALALAGIIGARLFYVVGHWDYYSRNLTEIIQVHRGGLVFYGGLLFGVLAAIGVARIRKVSVLRIADSLASPLALGMVVARIGCFLNGCSYGHPTNLPWGVNFFDVPRHPTQLYELIHSLLIFLFLFLYVEKRFEFKRNGSLFLVYVILYSFGRFLLEFLRDSPLILKYFTFSGFASLVLFVVSGLLLLRRYRMKQL